MVGYLQKIEYYENNFSFIATFSSSACINFSLEKNYITIELNKNNIEKLFNLDILNKIKYALEKKLKLKEILKKELHLSSFTHKVVWFLEGKKCNFFF